MGLIKDVIVVARNSGQGFLIFWLCFLLVLGAVFLCAAAWQLRALCKQCSHEHEQAVRGGLRRLFLLAALCLGSLYLWLLPPLSAPDEVAHYAGAYALSSRLLGQPVWTEDGELRIRAQDMFIDDDPGDGQPDYATPVSARLELRSYIVLHERGLGAEPQAEGYSFSQQKPVPTIFMAYLPQALGFSLARLLGLGGFGLLYLGRLCNFFLYLISVYAAMRIFEKGQSIFMLCALLPMSLELAASLSYDCYIISLSFLLTALSCAGMGGERKLGLMDSLPLSIAAALLAPCKLVYSCLALLPFLIPGRRWDSCRSRLLGLGLLCGLSLASLLFFNRHTLNQLLTAKAPSVQAGTVQADAAETSAAFAIAADSDAELASIAAFETESGAAAGTLHKTEPGTDTGVLSETESGAAAKAVNVLRDEPKYRLSQLLAEPLLFPSLLLHTLHIQGRILLGGIVGEWPGALDYGLSMRQEMLWYCLALLCFFAWPLKAKSSSEAADGSRSIGALSGEESVLTPLQGWACLGIALLTALALSLSMLLAYTPAREDAILGLQGRYFLPLLPLFLLWLRSLPLPLRLRMPALPGLRAVLLFVFLTAEFWFVLHFFRLICLRV